MGIFLRLLFLAAAAWVGFLLLSEASRQGQAAVPDPSKVIVLYGAIIIDGVVVAGMLALIVVPAIGEWLGGLFFNPGQQIEHDFHSDAIAKLAQGDPEGAIADYEDIYSKDPSDTLALSEIARICCRDLGDTARAATVLERALENEWPHEQSSFLANRLADVYLLQDDPLRAREVITQIAETLPGTKYGANALHRLHEIDRSLETGIRAPTDLKGPREDPAEEEAAEERVPDAGETAG
jgi:hypothetical protein